MTETWNVTETGTEKETCTGTVTETGTKTGTGIGGTVTGKGAEELSGTGTGKCDCMVNIDLVRQIHAENDLHAYLASLPLGSAKCARKDSVGCKECKEH